MAHFPLFFKLNEREKVVVSLCGNYSLIFFLFYPSLFR